MCVGGVGGILKYPKVFRVLIDVKIVLLEKNLLINQSLTLQLHK